MAAEDHEPPGAPVAPNVGDFRIEGPEIKCKVGYRGVLKQTWVLPQKVQAGLLGSPCPGSDYRCVVVPSVVLDPMSLDPHKLKSIKELVIPTASST